MRIQLQYVPISIPAAVILSMTMLLNGCQTAPDSGIKTAQYQTTTQPSNHYNRDKGEIAKIRTTLAAEYIRKNELDAAKREIDKALAADSRYAPAYDMMGTLLQQEGSSINLQKADAAYKQAIALDASFMQARNNYGVYLFQMKRYAEAVQQFEVAGAELGYESRIGALENLGRAQLMLGNKPAATQAFIRAIEGNRNSIIAHIELVDLLIEQNRIAQAQSLYEETGELLRHEPISPRLLLQGIKLAAAHGNINDRHALAQQLLSSYPLSNEAKQLKTWLNNPEASWK